MAPTAITTVVDVDDEDDGGGRGSKTGTEQIKHSWLHEAQDITDLEHSEKYDAAREWQNTDGHRHHCARRCHFFHRRIDGFDYRYARAGRDYLHEYTMRALQFVVLPVLMAMRNMPLNTNCDHPSVKLSDFLIL